MINKVNDLQLTPNFNLREFQSPDTCTVMIRHELITKLQALRTIVRVPIRITSGYRTPARNTAVGGHPNSRHMFGRAADVVIGKYSPDQITNWSRLVGFKTIIYYPDKGHYHLDIGD